MKGDELGPKLLKHFHNLEFWYSTDNKYLNVQKKKSRARVQAHIQQSEDRVGGEEVSVVCFRTPLPAEGGSV